MPNRKRTKQYEEEVVEECGSSWEGEGKEAAVVVVVVEGGDRHEKDTPSPASDRTPFANALAHCRVESACDRAVPNCSLVALVSCAANRFHPGHCLHDEHKDEKGVPPSNAETASHTKAAALEARGTSMMEDHDKRLEEVSLVLAVHDAP